MPILDLIGCCFRGLDQRDAQAGRVSALARFKPKAAMCVTLGVLVGGCNFNASEADPLLGGQTGDGSDANHPEFAAAEVMPQCPLDDGESVDGLDTELEGLDFTPQDVLDVVLAKFDSSLTWDPSGGFHTSPEQGQGEITLSFEYGDGRIWLYRPAEPPADQTAQSSGMPELASSLTADGCHNELVIEAVLTVSTPGGALQETLDVTLGASSLDLVHYDAKFDSSTLMGDLTLQIDGGDPPSSFEIAGDVSPFGITGKLTAIWDSASEDTSASNSDGLTQVVRAIDGSVAVWPALGDCQSTDGDSEWIRVPLDQELGDFSVSDAYQVVSGLPTPLPLFWADSSETELTLKVNEPTWSCVQPREGSLRFAVPFGAQTADGRLDAEYVGLANVWLAESDGFSVSLLVELMPGRDEVVDSTGLTQLDTAKLSELDDFHYSFSLSSSGESPTNGSLVLSADQGECAPIDAAMDRPLGAPGCTTSKELENASIGTAPPPLQDPETQQSSALPELEPQK